MFLTVLATTLWVVLSPPAGLGDQPRVNAPKKEWVEAKTYTGLKIEPSSTKEECEFKLGMMKTWPCPEIAPSGDTAGDTPPGSEAEVCFRAQREYLYRHSFHDASVCLPVQDGELVEGVITLGGPR